MFKSVIKPKHEVTGIILAGGLGRRLGGKDKGTLRFKQELLIEKQVDWLEGQTQTILISANQNINFYEKYSYPVLQDKNKEFLGPLSGVLRGLENCKTDWMFVHPIDVPNLPTDFLERFISRIKIKNNSYFACTPNRKHFLTMLIHRDCLGQLNEFVESGNSRVGMFHKAIRSIGLDIGLDEEYFKNLNENSDYDQSL